MTSFWGVESMSYSELSERKEELVNWLQRIEIKDVLSKRKKGKRGAPSSTEIPYTPKTDTHWDFVMKEMMWLGADFQGERKRQLSLAKKCASSVKQFHKTKEARRLRELQQAETKRRKLAAKMGRDIKGWWTKIERVISYKQKLQADEERQKAMNKQLVVLVQQTERYSESLTKQKESDVGEDSDDFESDPDHPGSPGRRRRKRLTIEEALAMERNRKSKQKVLDYSRIRLEDKEFYGESTASDNSGSDGSYIPESDTDDESTLKEAMDDELTERRNRKRKPASDTYSIFKADPEEIRKLHEEIEMDIQKVIERFQIEGGIETPDKTESPERKSKRRVQFKKETKSVEASPSIVEDPGNDADDDGDASDVEDYDSTQHQSDEDEFSACDPEVDDETTIAQEEKFPQEMSGKDEIDLLKREGEMSLEDLRKLYAGMDDSNQQEVEKEKKVPKSTRASTRACTRAQANIKEDDDECVKEDDEEFSPSVIAEIDDETTIDAEEKLRREMSHEEEMSLLQKDSEIPIEALREMYAAMEYSNGTGSKNSEEQISDEMVEDEESEEVTEQTSHLNAVLSSQVSEGESDGGDEFEPDATQIVDDETTMEAEEMLGREMSYKEEMDLLKKENEIPVEQLRAVYAQMNDSLDDIDPDIEFNTIERTDEKVPVAGVTSDEDGEEYQMNETEAVDDETTIEAEERLGRNMSHEEEMAILKNESEIPIEKLRAMYQAMNDDAESVASDDTEVAGSAKPSTIAVLMSSTIEQEVENEEYEPNGSEPVDDETTIEAEERLGQEMSYEDEVALLKKENEMSVEALRAMYENMERGIKECYEESQNSKMEVDSNGESSLANDNRHPSKRKRADEDSVKGKKARNDEMEEDSDDAAAALNVLEASAERARRTLASRPYLLTYSVKLRKYQQTGLNWLVSLQSRRLNGILADEMGLGKTLQTISLLSYLASYKGIWGPHLVVVPTSVIINWESELKRFCPALKVLCYYGSAKRRKELRTGWTKTNWYHVVITSYQLAVQDAFAFKRKKWYYLILDEAQNIKNFQSQRWQTLINFNTQRRLLLTGTPLQNSLMELWSLLHFLMPYIFRSRKEFSYWFSNPMNNIIEGNADRNDGIIKKLHGIIRPFILRRLKKDVETQMPGKFEHIVKCQLSRRQMQLYEEFLSRSSTRAALKKGGNFMGMMNVLMQLRKVCNHPDLFEARSIITPFVVPSLRYTIPSFLYTVKTTMSAIDNVSETLIQPIWCGSTGLPSITAALRHNQIESKQLRRLRTSLDKEALLSVADENDQDCPDELKTLLKGVHALRRSQKAEKIDFHNTINSRRCLSSEFPYSSQLLDSVKIDVNIFDRSEPVELNKRNIVSTPAALLRMRRKEQERANQLDGTIEKFVFCVPKAGARPLILATTGPMPQEYSSRYMKEIEEVFMDPLEIYLKPGRKAHARLSSFFPDKKFIQYDAGKLQILAELLRKLKRGGHRCLIFTQMSKMLDILEAFLNIHGHTYLRLDGATGVDRRQRYMDRFNNDTKVFCFILSTRSGGMGINLTGADTVIFYDSDWNPAMDAQAQDRAHRIGQTREVHIYRLITEHSIEENILMKAKQKRNLDIMVMDQGKFDASQQQSGDVADQVKNVYTKGGLRAILGVTEDYPNNHDDDIIEQKEAADMSNEQMEQAMASLEDEDDAQALRGAQKEAAEELEEFDENAEIKRDEDEGDDENDARDDTAARPIKRRKGEEDIEANDKKSGEEQKSQENDLEKEFVALQNTVGIDASTIDSALSPMEKYALNFREDIDPFFSIFYINEHNRKLEVSQIQDDIDIEGIERGKAIEERQAMDDGDLLATRPRPESLIRQRNLYQRERLRLRSGKKRRKLTGEAWSSKIDGLTKKPFWYNADTGEAIWNKPIVLLELEANDLALEKGWGFLPTKDLVNVMEFLIPFPDRQRCSAVCRQWRAAANDIRFVRHVYPVEMGAITGANQLHNHFNTIADALAVALPGDTIELSDGHYWVTEPGLLFDKPVKVIGDDNNASNVVIEMSGTLEWAAKGGWMEGVTFRRPKISTGAPVSYSILKMTGKAKIDIFHCVFDNGGSTGSTIALSGSGAKGSWNDIVVRNGGTNGIEIEGELSLDLRKSIIKSNKEHGLKCSKKGKFRLLDTKVTKNEGFGLDCKSGSVCEIKKCAFNSNKRGVMSKESGCNFTCSSNTALVFTPPEKNIPGFKISTINESSNKDALKN